MKIIASSCPSSKLYDGLILRLEPETNNEEFTLALIRDSLSSPRMPIGMAGFDSDHPENRVKSAYAEYLCESNQGVENLYNILSERLRTLGHEVEFAFPEMKS